MPTETEFRTAASGMREAGDAALGVLSSIAGSRDHTGMTGASVVEVTMLDGLNAGVHNAAALAEKCYSLATVLDARADICRAYWDSVDAWASHYHQWLISSASDPTLPEPRRPDKPHHWVD